MPSRPLPYRLLRRENNKYNIYKEITLREDLLSEKVLLRRENNKYNIYKMIQRFAGTKTLRVKQAFCKVNNKIQQLRGDNALAEIVSTYKQGEAL